tara:strand:+ start:17 stop:568 length:552 start_codon:yes stop_codon:yes gene_type:complete
VTELYRHFDAQDNLLYVGISLSTVSRLSQHKDHSHWFKEISKVTIQRFPTREEALKAEMLAVFAENPKCNINLKKKEKDLKVEKEKHQKEFLQKITPKEMSDYSRRSLLGRVVDFEVCYSLKEVQDLIGITKVELERYITNGNLLYFEVEGANTGRWPVKIHKKVTGWQFINFLDFLQNKGKK